MRGQSFIWAHDCPQAQASYFSPVKIQGLLLHQVGFTTLTSFLGERGVLLPHFSPLPPFRRDPLKWRSMVSAALSLPRSTAGRWTLSTTAFLPQNCGIQCPDFPPRSIARRLPACLIINIISLNL